QDLLDDGGVQPRESQGCEQAERDRVAVRELVVGGRLQRVRERMPEVEPRARAVLEWVAHADRGLERRATPDELGIGQLPERLAGEGACLPLVRELVAGPVT